MDYQDYLKEQSIRDLSQILKKYGKGVVSNTTPFVKEDEEPMKGATVELTNAESAAARVSEISDYYSDLLGPAYYSGIARVGTFITYNDYEEKGSDRRKGALIIGYLYKGAVYKNQLEIKSLPAAERIPIERAIGSGLFHYIIRLYEKGKGLASTKAIPMLSLYAIPSESKQLAKALECLKWTIVSSQLSSKVFGLASIKEKLVGDIVKGVTVEHGKIAKLNQQSYYLTVPLPQDSDESRKVKFCVRDLVPVIPSCNGYNAVKDKTIVKGALVRLCNDKGCKNISRGAVFTVTGIKSNMQSGRISVRSRNHKLDIVSGLYEGRMVRCYAKNLKLVK